MMQSAQSRHRDDFAIRNGIRFVFAPAGRLLRQREVRPVLVVIANEFGHEPFQVAFVEDDHMIEQIPAASADETLRHAILPRTLEAGSLGLNIEAFYRVNHFIIEIGAVVEDQERAEVSYGNASRNCWTTQALVGCLVTL